jgi:hypothetical protein
LRDWLCAILSGTDIGGTAGNIPGEYKALKDVDSIVERLEQMISLQEEPI